LFPKEKPVPSVEVKIDGPSFEAKLTWDGKLKPLTRTGNQYTASFDAGDGDHVYAVVAFGAPGEAWTATISATQSNQHAGHISPAGVDTTGDTVIHV
jgi:hypothetical protein